MSQLIKIANIAISEGVKKDNTPWKKWTITGEDKTSASTFDSPASSLNVGDTIDAEIELKGKFANIKTFKVVEHGAPEPEAPTLAKVAPAKVAPLANRDDAISEAVAVKAVIELLSAKIIDLKHPLAIRALVFLDKHLPETKPTQSQDAPERITLIG